MNKVDSYKITINKLKSLEDKNEIIPRCYEVNYLSNEKEMIINIDNNENKSKNIYNGKGLCGRWCYEKGKYILFFQTNILTKEKDYEKVKEKNKELMEILPFMINYIIRAEEKFFLINKNLFKSEIFIKFNSLNDDFFRVDNFGKIEDYININSEGNKVFKKFEDNKTNDSNGNKEETEVNKNKTDVNEDIILNLLNPHIETHLLPMYGRNIKYLIQDIEILSKKELENISGLEKTHEIVVSVKVLEGNILTETILEILINPNSITIKKIA